MSSRFCEQCGAAVTADDKFCGTCGNPVSSEEPSPAPDPVPAFLTPEAHVTANPAASSAPAAPAWNQPQPLSSPAQPAAQPFVGQQPGASASSGPSLGLIVGGLVLVLAVLGGGGWYGWNLYTKSLGKPATTAQGGTKQGGAAQAGSRQPGSQSAPVQDGDRFLGQWTPEKQDDPTENQEVGIVRQGSLLIGTNPSDPKGRIELNVGPGDKLDGVYKQEGETDIPVTAELLNDGKRLVLTLAPPQSEFETVILMRVNEAERAAALAGQDQSPAEIPGIVPISGVDEAYAQKVVSQQKEVKEFIDLLAKNGKSPNFDIEPEDANYWMVRVYEIVDDGDGMSHTATFGWYKVDRTTAAVSPGM